MAVSPFPSQGIRTWFHPSSPVASNSTDLPRLLLAVVVLLLVIALMAPRPTEMQLAVAPLPAGYEEGLIQVTEVSPMVPSSLPRTEPGLGPDEGIFLQVDGAYFFIAAGQRHLIAEDEVRSELRLNPLRFVRAVDAEEARRYPLAAR